MAFSCGRAGCARFGWASMRTSAAAAAVAAVAAGMAPGAAFAAEYVEGTTPEIVLMAGTADGTTNTLAEAIEAYNAASNTTYTIDSFNGGELKGYAIVKEGDGTLKMNTAISDFTGPVVIKDGVVKCMCTGALGADTTNSHVYVRSGATFYVRRLGDSEDIKNENRNLHVVGDGHNGQGALNVDKARMSSSYNLSGIYGKRLYLDGDATVVHPSWAVLASPVYLNSHTLVIKSADSFSSSSAYCNATVEVGSLYGPGKLVIDDSIYRLSDNKFNDTTDGNEIEIRNNGGFRFWQTTYTGHTWPFNFTGDVAWLWGDNNDGYFFYSKGGSQNCNRIFNPMRLNGTTLKMRTQSGGIYDNWVLLAAPISGNGNINLECETWNAFPAGRLSLQNTANSFVGTATVDKGVLYVHEPGSLPSEVPVVVSRSHALDYKLQKSEWVLDYYGVEFVAPGSHALSNLTFTSVTNKQNLVYQSGRIQGGSGTFAQIDKLSPNTMEYYSGIGSPLLNVEGGTVKLPRGPAPGLWEGTNQTDNISDLTGDQRSSNWHYTFTAKAAATNLVARGPNVMNMTYKAHFGAPKDSWKVAVYSGYLWNRETTNVTWTFVASILQYARVYIDGVKAIDHSYVSDNNHQSPAHNFVRVPLTPGPHQIQIRACCGALIGDDVTWPKNFGLAYDKLGREVKEADYPNGNYSSISNNFQVALDPGDGSLFTRSDDLADLPHFDEMRFASGTILDLNGNAYVASTFCGLPAVVSSAEDASAAPSLTITNRFVVNATDILSGGKMTLPMPLVFDERCQVSVTNMPAAALASGVYTLAEVSGEGNDVTLARTTCRNAKFDANGWCIRLSQDKRKLELAHAPGFRLFVR